jgi:hypothetical protein
MLNWEPARRRIRSDFGNADTYKFYKQSVSNPVSNGLHIQIQKEFFNIIFNKIILENFVFRMPLGLGYIRINRTRRIVHLDNEGNIDPSNLQINWKKTVDLWERKYPGKTAEEITHIKGKRIVYDLNEHTDMYSCRFYWDKTASKTKNHFFYKFRCCRTNNRALARALKSDRKLINIFYEKQHFDFRIK